MTSQPKFLHVARGSMAGRHSSVALCGRLVGRMSLLHPTEADRVTCPKCATKAAEAGLGEAAPVVEAPAAPAEPVTYTLGVFQGASNGAMWCHVLRSDNPRRAMCGTIGWASYWTAEEGKARAQANCPRCRKRLGFGVIVSENLTDGEAAEAVRRLEKGGTGVRLDRQPIAATVARGDHGVAVIVKDPEDAEAARALLHAEGWPTVTHEAQRPAVAR